MTMTIQDLQNSLDAQETIITELQNSGVSAPADLTPQVTQLNKQNDQLQALLTPPAPVAPSGGTTPTPAPDAPPASGAAS